MPDLTRTDIVAGLRALGLAPGERVLVHSSLSALGQVEGGADTVIDALLEAVGSEGLVAVPTFGGAQPFDRRSTPTNLGCIPDRFWRRPEAVRSLHPTHSVAAIGKGAAELIADHEKAPTAYGEGTPYHKLAMTGGKILFIGVDQDRNTSLHAAEALAGMSYLKEVERGYVADSGEVATIPVAAMAGPHRNFLGLDPLFRERGIMRMGKIGRAVCRLIDGKTMLETALEALRRDPAVMLCDNPACADCVRQREAVGAVPLSDQDFLAALAEAHLQAGSVKAARLAQEDFTLAAVTADISEDPEVIFGALRAEGISALEMTGEEYNRWGHALPEGFRIVALRGTFDDGVTIGLAERLGLPLILPVGDREEYEAAAELRAGGMTVYLQNTWQTSGFYRGLYAGSESDPPLAFSPARFAGAAEHPFLQVFYRGPLRRNTAHVYVDDALWDGTPTLPGRGNAEVKEIISILRCRSFGGVLALRSHTPGVAAFRQAAGAFWKLLETM
jgi:aminoglycoside 3-N-acetyltransferase